MQLWQKGQLPLVTWHFLHLSLGEIGERGQTFVPQVTAGYSEHYNLCTAALSSSQFGYWLFSSSEKELEAGDCPSLPEQVGAEITEAQAFNSSPTRTSGKAER